MKLKQNRTLDQIDKEIIHAVIDALIARVISLEKEVSEIKMFLEIDPEGVYDRENT